ncbi:MAG: hypothetical protein ACOX7P_08840 [Oscillospiraceae bacterium]|jgi:hypothetical protein
MPAVKSKNYKLWLAYGLSAVLLLLFQTAFMTRFPIHGVTPIIVPVCVAVAAVYEGPIPAAGFGLYCGLLLDASGSNDIWLYTVYLPLAGLGIGFIASYARVIFFSCFVWSLAILIPVAMGQIFYYWLIRDGDPLLVLKIAAVQTVYSVIFAVPIRYWFGAIHKKFD